MPKFYLSRTECDTYVTTIEADSEEEAIAKADELWDDEGPQAFNWKNGSVDDWEPDRGT